MPVAVGLELNEFRLIHDIAAGAVTSPCKGEVGDPDLIGGSRVGIKVVRRV